MKKLIVIFLLAIMWSCAFTSQQKAERMVKNYLDTTLNDPKSYESVSFGKLLYLKDTTDSFDGKVDTFKLEGLNEIEHTYRAKNGFGGVITKTEYFQLDFKANRVTSVTAEPHNHY